MTGRCAESIKAFDLRLVRIMIAIVIIIVTVIIVIVVIVVSRFSMVIAESHHRMGFLPALPSSPTPLRSGTQPLRGWVVIACLHA